MTAAWRRRRNRATGGMEDDRPMPARRGLRGRIGLSPYHRNPAHVLLANPGVLAGLLLVLALALRVVEVQRATYTPVHDGRSYMVLGGQIAQSGDYATDQNGAGQTKVGPTAYFAPAYPYLLGALDFATGNPALSSSQVRVDRYAQIVLGVMIVGLIGLIALELFGIDMALLAMALAAIYPPLIEMSSILAAETLMTVFLLAAVAAALRMRRARDPLRWTIVCGMFIGLAALTHPNAILLLIPLGIAATQVVPVLGRRKVGGLLVLLASTLLTLTPWLVRDGIVMHQFVPITDQSGITLAGTYNASSAHAQPAYQWLYFRQVPAFAALARHSSDLTETQLSSKLDSRALSYIANHPSAVVGAAWHNSLRMLELEGTHAWHASAVSVGLTIGTAHIGVICFWVVGVLALLGVVAPRGLRAPGWLWLVPVVMWLSAVLINGETPRFRTAVDPFLILLAARGVARVAGWIKARPRQPARVMART